MSGLGATGEITKPEELGDQAFLQKLYTAESLATTVYAVLKGN